jgi:hypothetical protein
VRLVFRALPVAALVAALFSFCASAGAAIVTLGPSLSGTWEPSECESPICVSSNYDLAGTGTFVTSPVNGAVVRFNVVGGETAGTYRLRTLVPAKESAAIALFRKASATVAVVPNPGIQSYSTLLPIRVGEAVGLSQTEGATLGFMEPAGARFGEWLSEPAENTSAGSLGGNGLLGYNVEVQPEPAITSLGVASGPLAGGTVVPIAGTDFANVTAVAFGGAPAASFSVNSEGSLTAVAPARATAGAVSVTVTTIAGKATAPATFTYEAPPVVLPPPVVQHCVVPNLKGKNLKAARGALEKAKCKLGKVTKLGGATAKSGKVAKQGAKAGAKVGVGTKVAITLKPPKAPKPSTKPPSTSTVSCSFCASGAHKEQRQDGR